MQVALRQAALSDIKEIADLVNQAYRPASQLRGWTHEADLVSGDRVSLEQLLALFGVASRILVLCHEHRIVACVHLRHKGRASCIGMLATHIDFQDRGLGGLMLMHAEEYAVEHFDADTFCMSVLSARPELIAFYERRGYIRTGEQEDYPLAAGVGLPRVNDLYVICLAKPVYELVKDRSLS